MITFLEYRTRLEIQVVGLVRRFNHQFNRCIRTSEDGFKIEVMAGGMSVETDKDRDRILRAFDRRVNKVIEWLGKPAL